MRLGAIEQAILLACLAHRQERKHKYEADLYRDELPAILWGWKSRRAYSKRGHQYRAELYVDVGISTRDYQAKQATLTRALQSLYRKGLIDGGNVYEATGVKVYSAKRAAVLGIAPERPLTEAELYKTHHPDHYVIGASNRPWTKKGHGAKPHQYRNMKTLRLTDEGLSVVQALALKRQNATDAGEGKNP
jgi:hypothetical protein